jgi:hypothetical protein
LLTGQIAPQSGPTLAKPSGENIPLGGFVLMERERAKMQRSWAFKDDRRVMELAKASRTLEEIAKAMDRSPDRIRKVAIRLGLSIKSNSSHAND